MSRTAPVDVPLESALAGSLAGAHLVDAYGIDLPANDPRSAMQLARDALGSPPRWFRLLLTIRDAAVAPFGLKTAARMRALAGKSASRKIDFFPVISESPQEVILGEDDRHLDFRASLLVRPGPHPGTRRLVATTVVHCHNGWGRAYIALIRPFHVVVVRSSLRRAARMGQG